MEGMLQHYRSVVGILAVPSEQHQTLKDMFQVRLAGPAIWKCMPLHLRYATSTPPPPRPLVNHKQGTP
jgi:hypothetical protein